MKLFNDPRFNNLFDGIECVDTVTSAVHAVLVVLEDEPFDDQIDSEDLIKWRRSAVREIYGVLKSIAESGDHRDILEHPILPVYRVLVCGVQQAEEFVDRKDAVVFGYDKVHKILRERRETAQASLTAFGQAVTPCSVPTFEVIDP